MGDRIQTKVNLREFEKCAADRVILGVITKENGATITRIGMDGKMQTVEANAGDKFYKGDVVQTSDKAGLQIQLPDQSVLNVKAGSKVDMGQWDIAPSLPSRGGSGSLDVINSKPPAEFKSQFIFSPSNGGVRG